MSENLDIKFDKGFNETRKEDTVLLSYSDEKVFVSNCPVDERVVKDLDKYKRSYGQQFLQTSIEEATPRFQKDDSIKTIVTDASYGVNKSDTIEVYMQKDVKQSIIDFKGNEPKKEITTCSIKVKTKTGAGLSKSEIKRSKDQLHTSLYGEKK